MFQQPFDTFRENGLRSFWCANVIVLYTYNRSAFYMKKSIHKYECTYIFGTQNTVFSLQISDLIWT